MKRFNDNLDVLPELFYKTRKSKGLIYPNPFSGFNKKVRERINEMSEETIEANSLKYKQPSFPKDQEDFVITMFTHELPD